MMKRVLRSIFCALIACVMLFGIVACDGSAAGGDGSFTYDDGISASGKYDTEHFYRNDRLVSYAADPGMIYVTEEMDPSGEYAGWFYFYATSRKGNGSLLGYKTKDFATYYNLGPVWGFELDGWGNNSKWAPEVIYNPNDHLYYFYYGANERGGSTSVLHIGVAVADNPEGPFIDYERVHEGESNIYNEVYSRSIRPINFSNHLDEMEDTSPINGGGISTEYGEKGEFGVIDASPFYDEKTIKTDASGNPVIGADGNYEYYYPLYLTFNLTVTNTSLYSTLWIMEMYDPATPNYYTVSPLTSPGYGAWTKDENNVFVRDESTYGGDNVPSYDSGVNEGNFLQYHYTTDPVTGEKTKRYYLTYANPGFGNKLYSTDVAVSTEIFGIGAPGRTKQTGDLVPYVKIGKITGNPMNGVEENWRNVSGAAHHSIVQAGEETFIAYHVWTDPLDNENGNTSDTGGVRSIAVDRINWRYNEELGYDIYHSNGPTTSLQPIPGVTSGMYNIAPKATITAKEGDKDTTAKAKLLIDKYVPIHSYSDSEVYRASGKTTFTLTWAEPYTINSLFVYNSYLYEEAFKKLDSVKLYLEDGRIYEAKDVLFNTDYFYKEYQFVEPGAAAVMGFDEISVTKIEIEVSEAYLDSASSYGVGEIYVMGRRTY